MKITFVLPLHTVTPVGGLKIVYEYANHLTLRGHQVTLLHRRIPPPVKGRKQRLRETLLPWMKEAEPSEPVPWFALNPGIDARIVDEVHPVALPDADILFATAWNTAEWIAPAGTEKGRKFYLIQHYEICMDEKEKQRIDATWRLPLHKIVIARWLYDLAVEFGEGGRTTHIPNSLDLQTFRIKTPCALRSVRIGMLHHEMEWKGSADGLAALMNLRSVFPELEAILFGTGPRPRALPRWIEYVRNPSPAELVTLYNRCAVFLQPSWTEGWGLTSTEAMACGCALVTTENGGSRDFAIENQTALVVPARNPEALANAAIRLLRDANLRNRLALTGHEFVQQFTWPRAVDKLEQVLQQHCALPELSAELSNHAN